MKAGLRVALLICAVVYVAHLLTRDFHPLQRELGVSIHGTFQPNGHFPGASLAHSRDVRFWGSWAGADENHGTITLGPFPAPARLRFAVGGWPGGNGNRIFLELVPTRERRVVAIADVGVGWSIVDADLPSHWVGRPLLLAAADAASGPGGWLALSEPLSGGRGAGDAAFFETLAAWLVNGLLFALLTYSAWRWLAAAAWLPASWEPLVAAAVVAAAGYVAFWIYFANATAGKFFSLALLGLAAAKLKPKARSPLPTRELMVVAMLMTGIGACYLALLHLFPSSLDFYSLAANRFRPALPGDNGLPHSVAATLFHGKTLRMPDADWLSSDRPPLQSGWQLLTWPVLRSLDLDERAASGTAAVWLQLLWVPAVYALLRSFRQRSSRAAAWTAVLALTGFFAQHTLFTWPKLSAAAFVCGAFALCVLDKRRPETTAPFWFVGFLAGLGWLSHGGVAFSLLALAPWAIGWAGRGHRRNLLRAMTAFLVLALPWLAYQKFYDPPGNRLLKWHLGGQVDKDSRGTWATVRDSYRASTWTEIRAAKVANFKRLIDGDWSLLANFSTEKFAERRDDEFFTVGRAFTWWILGFGGLAIAAVRARTRARLARDWRRHGALAGWIVASLVLWCALMFKGANTVVHQGSYAIVLSLFVLFSVWLELASRWSIVVVGGLQAASFATTWMIGNAVIHGPMSLLAAGTAVVAVVGLRRSLQLARGPRKKNVRVQNSPATSECATPATKSRADSPLVR